MLSRHLATTPTTPTTPDPRCLTTHAGVLTAELPSDQDVCVLVGRKINYIRHAFGCNQEPLGTVAPAAARSAWHRSIARRRRRDRHASHQRPSATSRAKPPNCQLDGESHALSRSQKVPVLLPHSLVKLSITGTNGLSHSQKAGKSPAFRTRIADTAAGIAGSISLGRWCLPVQKA